MSYLLLCREEDAKKLDGYISSYNLHTAATGELYDTSWFNKNKSCLATTFGMWNTLATINIYRKRAKKLGGEVLHLLSTKKLGGEVLQLLSTVYLYYYMTNIFFLKHDKKI
jgi:hypothetical protein